VIYFHGFGDRLDNHKPLFDAWNAVGLRVVAFDLPSHGEDSGFSNLIDLYSFQELGELATKVEASKREDETRPLILAGWSTGELIATQMIQKEIFKAQGGRVPRALIFFAPAISVPLFMSWIMSQTTSARKCVLRRLPLQPKLPAQMLPLRHSIVARAAN
jgi:alpha-beta hydrolase superfamily lysophospholipase